MRILNLIDDDILLFIDLLLIKYYGAIIRCSSRKQQFFAEVSKNLARYRYENNFIRSSKLLHICTYCKTFKR